MRTLDDLTASNARHGEWLAQPKWVRIYTLAVGLPAWLVGMASLFLGKMLTGTPLLIVMVLFGSAAVLQLAFVARAYWRMDI